MVAAKTLVEATAMGISRPSKTSSPTLGRSYPDRLKQW